MHQINKTYPLHQSPFYKLRSKKKLSSLLGISTKLLFELSRDENYRVFTKDGRKIQEPLGVLKAVHRKIKKYLCRLEYPNYLFSGIKNRSAIKNAQFHVTNDHILVIDIKRFYRCCNGKYVFRFFRDTMKMSQDTAWILSKIVCYNDFIPTGSPSSQVISFLAYSNIFSKINRLCEDYEIKFSLYVDDMTFSSSRTIPRNFHIKIDRILNVVSLCIKKTKTQYYHEFQVKKVTGCIITPQNRLEVPNKIKKKTITLLKKNSQSSDENIEKNIASLLGLINQAQQIEHSIFEKTKSQLLLRQRRNRVQAKISH